MVGLIITKPELAILIQRIVYHKDKGSLDIRDDPNIDIFISGNDVICWQSPKARAFDIRKRHTLFISFDNFKDQTGIDPFDRKGAVITDSEKRKVMEQLITFFFQAIEVGAPGNKIVQGFREAFGFQLPYEVTLNYITRGLSFSVKAEAGRVRYLTFEQVIDKLSNAMLKNCKAR